MDLGTTIGGFFGLMFGLGMIFMLKPIAREDALAVAREAISIDTWINVGALVMFVGMVAVWSVAGSTHQ